MMPPPDWAFPASFDALLFDMDGTMLNSIAVAERIWGRWAAEHGLDAERFVPTVHGKRGIETIAALALPGVDPALESDKITAAELIDMDGIVAIEGMHALLHALPAERWAVVTSAPLALARRRLAAARLPEPAVLVTAEDVRRGKPHPECYRLAAERLAADPARCLVIEDAAAGIEAGEAAGATLLVITATHRHHLATSHRTVRDYTGLTIGRDADGRILITGCDPGRRLTNLRSKPD
jgi:sugar-phosphatase